MKRRYSHVVDSIEARFLQTFNFSISHMVSPQHFNLKDIHAHPDHTMNKRVSKLQYEQRFIQITISMFIKESVIIVVLDENRNLRNKKLFAIR